MFPKDLKISVFEKVPQKFDMAVQYLKDNPRLFAQDSRSFLTRLGLSNDDVGRAFREAKVEPLETEYHVDWDTKTGEGQRSLPGILGDAQSGVKSLPETCQALTDIGWTPEQIIVATDRPELHKRSLQEDVVKERSVSIIFPNFSTLQI